MAEATMARSTSDEALEQAAEYALRNYSGVRVWTDALKLTATNGVVEVSGYVRTQAEKEVTEDVVLATAGVKDVVSNLFVDTDLEIAVAKALGDDARTRPGFPGILVGSAFGDIYLKGNVSSAEIKKAADEIVPKVKGVRSVFNRLETTAAARAASAPAKAAAPGAPATKAVPAPGAKTVPVPKPGAKPVPVPAPNRAGATGGAKPVPVPAPNRAGAAGGAKPVPVPPPNRGGAAAAKPAAVPAPKVVTPEPVAEAAPEVEVEETVIETPTAQVVEETVAAVAAPVAAEAAAPVEEEETPAAPPKVIVTSSGARITPVPAPKINRPKK